MTGFDFLGVELILALVGAAGITAVLFVAWWIVRLLPIGRSRREGLARSGPIIVGVILLVYLVLLARTLFRSEPRFVPVAIALTVVGFVAACWGALRDMASGAFVKAGRICRIGDQVSIDGISGRVRHMGLRVVTLETSQGEEALIPYSRIAGGAILRAPVAETAALHVFRLPKPAALSVAQSKQAIIEAALTSHWSSVAREPEIQLVDGSTFEVSVYALDPDRGADVEARVRSRLGAAERRG